ncbi:hypothetical protein GCM10011415_22530 [Salipiger pallidus]|uniref:Uncharacterized protein n=1 Tax=Salipiger pallidus TaxID=1775170 RepID=A0A8J3EHC9_9RHOB|nr:hypothetical protein [Salipiger pallidus]GGG73681.1 hypothetical protein GCM10011415_22530 [Salipiger pallidus]
MRATAFLAAAAAFTLTASQAFAWNDMYRGDATSDVTRQPLVQAYPAANYCPGGLEPVINGGVIYCGTPTAGTYYNPADHLPRKARGATRAAHRSYMPQPYAPVGEKGVVYQ